MADYQLQYEGPDIDRRLNLAGTAIQPEAGKGLYPDVDAEKLEGIEDGAQVNKVESISRNGEAIVPDENKNYDIDVPTKVSELENDADYISDAPSNEEIYGRENRQWKAAAYKEDVEWGDF